MVCFISKIRMRLFSSEALVLYMFCEIYCKEIATDIYFLWQFINIQNLKYCHVDPQVHFLLFSPDGNWTLVVVSVLNQNIAVKLVWIIWAVWCSITSASWSLNIFEAYTMASVISWFSPGFLYYYYWNLYKEVLFSPDLVTLVLQKELHFLNLDEQMDRAGKRYSGWVVFSKQYFQQD